MKKAEVQIGERYVAKISGKLTVVKLGRACDHGGWWAVNVNTGREVRIRTAAKLRRAANEPRHGLDTNLPDNPILKAMDRLAELK